MADIVFRNVTKRYGNTLAVDDASFTVNDNEFFCFFGPPLSGKSTVLRLVLGLETPDAGEILIGGRPVNTVSPAERNVAMVFQNLALFPHMSARDNVRFPLVERRVAEADIERRVADVAAKLHIGHILHKPPAQLSGGERQRVAIARALVRDPAAYLMDDPISALDARLREETRVELKRIQRELGKTLIYVTHDQEEAMSVADRIAILEDGKIRQIGAPAEIYDRPASTYVARLLGSPMMNILKSVRGEGGVEAAEGAIRIADKAAPADAVEIGLRPEDIKVRPWLDGEISDGRAGRPARVFEVEPLGGYTVVTLAAGQARLRALLRGQPDIRPDAMVAISCEPARVHYFGQSGGALARCRRLQETSFGRIRWQTTGSSRT
ncbi:ABC transporter ATP-binding protein [Mesorhizobium sp. M6A.T.Cr.TU.017.01.1.1]|uniref:ABC transporter ATP-binding protein n=1 Tax=Mesorhizobium sp. M6A.T.Cr.TU.017.01.1.1 TaxID=2496774 RepID=UPI001FDEB3FA|nr:ABC transporter ATP-binding protein [Mesorhizobium sp. M6A.T.Cr.TU.017.01.1.1]